MSLATKYRPSTWSDMTEQSLIVKMLKNLCESGELSCRNFLLIGPAGVGKTTSARIIAKELNNGAGDTIELDAASNGSIDKVRELVDQAR